MKSTIKMFVSVNTHQLINHLFLRFLNKDPELCAICEIAMMCPKNYSALYFQQKKIAKYENTLQNLAGAYTQPGRGLQIGP